MTTPAPLDPHPLDPSLDTAAAAALRHALAARLDAGQPVLLDGGRVRRVGQACLQVLAAARAAAAADGTGYAVAGPSAELIRMAALAGLGAVLEPVG